VPAAAAHAAAAPRGLRKPHSSEVAAALLLAFAAPAADAQWSGTATIMSDYRYRGISLTQDKPAAQLAVVYDDPRDWYAGGQATTALARCAGDCGGVHVISYAGYASRLSSGVTLDAGANFSLTTGAQSYSFPELYVGLSYVNTTTRVSFSPRYFGQDTRSVYVDLSQSLPIHDGVRLLAHVGVLHLDNTPSYPPQPATTTDVLLGAAFDVAPFEVQATWQHAASPAYVYPVIASEKRSRFVVQLTYAF
jgi:uncharacterized protein (TIGR02001 family)